MSARDILLREEGLVLRPYKCSRGFLTIGVGRNLESVGISKEEAFMLLENDIADATTSAESFPWFSSLTPIRQDVIICMVFQLGMAGVKKFKKMIAALECHDYPEAVAQMLDSDWAVQTPERAKRMAKMMAEG